MTRRDGCHSLACWVAAACGSCTGSHSSTLRSERPSLSPVFLGCGLRRAGGGGRLAYTLWPHCSMQAGSHTLPGLPVHMWHVLSKKSRALYTPPPWVQATSQIISTAPPSPAACPGAVHGLYARTAARHLKRKASGGHGHARSLPSFIIIPTA